MNLNEEWKVVLKHKGATSGWLWKVQPPDGFEYIGWAYTRWGAKRAAENLIKRKRSTPTVIEYTV